MDKICDIQYPEPAGNMLVKKEINTHQVFLKPVRPVPTVTIQSVKVAVGFLREMKDYDRERFKVIYLDTKNRVIGVENIAEGTINQTLLNPREVVKGAMLANSAGVILAHNHPSGIPRPSLEDNAIVAKLVDAFGLMGIDVVDALVVAKEGYYSYLEDGKLKPLKEQLRLGGIMEAREGKDEACSVAVMAALDTLKKYCGPGKEETEIEIAGLKFKVLLPEEEIKIIRERPELTTEEKIEAVKATDWARNLVKGWLRSLMPFLTPGTPDYEKAYESMLEKVARGLAT